MASLYEQIQEQEFFRIEMASRAVTALDQLNHIIDYSPVLNSLKGLIGILHFNRCTLHLIIKWKTG